MQIFSYEDIMLTDFPPKDYIITGTKIDKISNGFAKKEIHLICGKSGQGKSLSMTHLAINCAIEGSKVFYIALENDQIDDLERIKDTGQTYNDYINENLLNNFKYVNLSEDTDIKERIKTIIEKLGENDIVFVDGTEFLITGKTSTEISENGRKLMLSLRNAARTSNSTIVMSWQTNRLAGMKKFEEIQVEDLSGSMSVPQQAYSVWYIGWWKEKSTLNWKMRYIKCRGKIINKKEDSFSTLNNKEEFYLRFTLEE